MGEDTIVRVEPFEILKAGAESIGVKNFTCCAHGGPRFVFLAEEKNVMLLFDMETNYTCSFDTESTEIPGILCLDISDDGELIVTGHDDGSIRIWAASESSPSQRVHRKMHQAKGKGCPISHVKFGGRDVIYASDKLGLTTEITFTDVVGLYKFKEREIHMSVDEPKQLIVSRVGDPFPVVIIVYSNRWVLIDPEAPVRKEESSLGIWRSPPCDEVPIISLIPRRQDYFVSVAVGNVVSVKQLRDPTKPISLCSEFKSKGKIVVNQFLSAGLLATMSVGSEENEASMTLLNIECEPVMTTTSASFNTLIAGPCTSLEYQERLMLLSNGELLALVFARWDDEIRKRVDEKKWHNAFDLLDKVKRNTTHDLIGVPTNESERLAKVEALAKTVLTKFWTEQLTMVGNGDIIDSANLIVSVKPDGFLEKEIYEMCLNSGKDAQFNLSNLFDGMVGRNDRAEFTKKLFTAKFVRQYMKFRRDGEDEEDIQTMEQQMCKYEFNEREVDGLIDVAIDFKLIYLAKYLLIKYEGDYLLPCELFCEAGKLSEYMTEIFLTPSGNDMKYHRQLLTSWLLYSPDGTYPRLRQLLSENWSLSGKTHGNFAKVVVDLLPINVSHKITIDQMYFMRAILAVMTEMKTEIRKDSKEVELLDTILPYLTEFEEFPMLGVGVSYVVDWIFTSHEHVQKREEILAKFIAMADNALPVGKNMPRRTFFDSEKLLRHCVQGGLAHQVIRLYDALKAESFEKYKLDEKRYEHMIAAKIISGDESKNIMKFVTDVVDDVMVRKEGDDKRRKEESKQDLYRALAAYAEVLTCYDARGFMDILNKISSVVHSKIAEKIVHGLPSKKMYYDAYIEKFGISNLKKSEVTELFRLYLQSDSIAKKASKEDAMKSRLKTSNPDEIGIRAKISKTFDKSGSKRSKRSVMKDGVLMYEGEDDQMMSATTTTHALTAMGFLRDYVTSTNIDFEDAETACKKFHAKDCLIEILVKKEDIITAAEEIGNKLKNRLSEFVDKYKIGNQDLTKTNDPADIPGIKDFKVLKEIKNAIEFLESCKNRAKRNDNKAQENDVKLACQLLMIKFHQPMAALLNPPSDTDLKCSKNMLNAMILLFSYFVVQVLAADIITPSHAFLILTVHFADIDQPMSELSDSVNSFRQILTRVFSRLNYEMEHSAQVDELFINDCMGINDRVIKLEGGSFPLTQAEQNNNTGDDTLPYCRACCEPLNKKLESFKMYSCGHCFHTQGRCGTHSKCPICGGKMQKRPMKETDDQRSANRTKEHSKYLSMMMDDVLKMDTMSIGDNMGSGIYFADRDPNEICSINIPQEFVEEDMTQSHACPAQLQLVRKDAQTNNTTTKQGSAQAGGNSGTADQQGNENGEVKE